MTDAKQFLMICYAFPPVGGAGVQRSVKFVKYLSRYGWKPTVLTVENPSVPVVDHDLLRDIPADIEVLRARTLEPSYRVKRNLIQPKSSQPSRLKTFLRKLATHWLQPDAQILWNRNAYRLARHAIEPSRYSAIYVSGPPFSSFLLGCKLKRRFGIPLILDFRDEWSLSAQYLENRSQIDSVVRSQIRLFEATLCQSDAIIATTHASAEELTECCKKVGSKALVRCIYNGFDPDDLLYLNRTQEKSEKYRLVYTGTLWRLTDIAPFVRAVKKLAASLPVAAQKLELHFVGRRTAEQDEILAQLAATPVSLYRHDYLSHQQSLLFACKADGLLLTLADQPGAQRVVPGKLFEYLALQQPILSIMADGEAAKLLSEHSLSKNIKSSDTDAIVAWLVAAIHAKSNRNLITPSVSHPLNLDWCSRDSLAGQLAALFDELCEMAKTP